MIPTYAVIPTYNRPEICLDAIASIRDQVDELLVIDSGLDQPMPSDPARYFLLRWYRPDPFNLSQAWNKGITMARIWSPGTGQWNVAIFNDDVIVPPGWVEACSAAMRRVGAAAVCSDSPTGHEILHTRPGPVDLRTRLKGWAFMLRGEAGIAADERLAWWFGDDDLDWKSRQAGGTLVIPGYPVENRFPNGLMTPQRQEQANRDGETFQSIWTMRPW